MNRRSYLSSIGIASGVLLAGSTTGDADSFTASSQTPSDSSNRIRTAGDLVRLSADEILALDGETVRRPFNPELGGGEAYDPDGLDGAEEYPHGGAVTRELATYVVSDADELETAAGDATAGEIIWVEGDAEVDMTGVSITLAGGVTLASDRGRDGSDGALLSQDENGFNAFISTGGDDVRLTGLRLSGPEHEYWDYEDKGIDSIYDVGITYGLLIDDTDDVEVDNCQFSGFTYAGIRVGMWGAYECEGVYIHHNEFVDNPSPALGYGINVYGGDPLIEYNYLDNNRRSIAGVGGDVPMNYTVRNNLFGPRTRLAPIDAHGGEVDDMDEPQAGVRMDIENNVVLSEKAAVSGAPQPAIVIRGVPRERATIRNNWFFTDRAPPFSADEGTGDDGGAIRQWTDQYTSITASNNVYGKFVLTEELGTAGTTWGPQQAHGNRDSN
ncbi:right-handed parallel beta-helix repeat-containing protein [Natronosalvus caseinilyticus]|uniref:right-handed parallel beta-helix repeat-containing protein n=1 Tax=Natronosalvus caseinilyticus TaxID=2953747 RepID=UPI0028AAFC26|nr:right-handed parallel beta-helix repeat-containing protein [Natronosalvus caseinilyticus]